MGDDEFPALGNSASQASRAPGHVGRIQLDEAGLFSINLDEGIIPLLAVVLRMFLFAHCCLPGQLVRN